jgi:hypothetical protein
MSDEANQTDQGSNDANLERLRAKAEEADALRAKLATIEKRDAFREAGIDPSSGPGQLLFDNINVEGELNADAVRAEAEKYGISPAAQQPAQQREAPQQQTQPDLSFFEESANVSSGGQTDPAEPGGYDRAAQAWNTVTQRGGGNEEAAHAAISEVMTAAANGDPSVLYNQEEWRRTNG